MKSFARIAILFLSALALPANAHALELLANSGSIQLPASSYHYLGYGAELAFGGPERRYTVEFGLSQPYSIEGYTQIIYFGGANVEWTLNHPGISPYAGIGLGLYADQVSKAVGVVPSLTFKGGVRFGGPRMGLQFGMTSYLGTVSYGLATWTAWPLLNLMGGIYVSL